MSDLFDNEKELRPFTFFWSTVAIAFCIWLGFKYMEFDFSISSIMPTILIIIFLLPFIKMYGFYFFVQIPAIISAFIVSPIYSKVFGAWKWGIAFLGCSICTGLFYITLNFLFSCSKSNNNANRQYIDKYYYEYYDDDEHLHNLEPR